MRADARTSKRIIISLSPPYGSTIPRINSFIPSKDFSLHYTTIYHAIALIKGLCPHQRVVAPTGKVNITSRLAHLWLQKQP